MRVIDADKLLGLFIESGQKHGSEHGCKLGENWLLDYNDIKAVIDNAPTVKPTTVYEFKGCDNCELERLKGKWEVVSTSEGTHFYGCSECQFAGDISDRFCRRCGADMREENI